MIIQVHPLEKTNYMSLRSKEVKFREIYASLKPFIVTCQIFCAIPFHLGLEEKILFVVPPTPSLRDRFLSICHAIWCLFIASSVITATHFQRIMFDGSLAFLTRIIYFFEYIGAASCFLLVIIGSHWHNHLYATVFERLIDIDVALAKFGVKIRYQSWRRLLWGVMLVYLAFFLVVLWVDFSYNQHVIGHFIRSSTVFCIPNVTWVLSLTQFAVVMGLVKERLEKINLVLKRLVEGDQDMKKIEQRFVFSIFTK